MQSFYSFSNSLSKLCYIAVSFILLPVECNTFCLLLNVSPHLMNQILYSFQICFFFRVLHFLIMIYNHVLELGYSIVNALSIRAPTSIGKCLFIYLRLFTQKYLKSFYFPLSFLQNH